MSTSKSAKNKKPVALWANLEVEFHGTDQDGQPVSKWLRIGEYGVAVKEGYGNDSLIINAVKQAKEEALKAGEDFNGLSFNCNHRVAFNLVSNEQRNEGFVPTAITK